MKRIIGIVVLSTMAGTAFAGDTFELNRITGKDISRAAASEIAVNAPVGAKADMYNGVVPDIRASVEAAFAALETDRGAASFGVRGNRGHSWPGGGHGGGYPPGTTCSYHDTGWEEHWGGHNSCGECLATHNDCNWSCSTDRYVCTAKGYRSASRLQSKEVDVDWAKLEKLITELNALTAKVIAGTATQEDKDRITILTAQIKELLGPGPVPPPDPYHPPLPPPAPVPAPAPPVEYTGEYRYSRYDAENSAIRACQWAGANNCAIDNCESVSETVDSGRCRK